MGLHFHPNSIAKLRMTHNPDSLGAALPTANATVELVRDPWIIPGDVGESYSRDPRIDRSAISFTKSRCVARMREKKFRCCDFSNPRARISHLDRGKIAFRSFERSLERVWVERTWTTKQRVNWKRPRFIVHRRRKARSKRMDGLQSRLDLLNF